MKSVKSPTKKSYAKKSPTKKSPVKIHIKKSPKNLKSIKPVIPTTCNNFNKIIYLDNNATTLICKPAAVEFNRWLSCFNPSSDSKIAQPAKLELEHAKKYILHHCNATNHTVIFTSGATESNCFILKSTSESYANIKGIIPHVIISSMEHSSIIDVCKLMEEEGKIELTMVSPNIYGCILPENVEREIKKNTAIISIMYANNETGSINNVKEIANISHKHKIPFHSDCVQIFGKTKINIPELGLDAISVSFHKLYGPKGIGLLIINNDLISGYKLHGQILGHQQNGLRGGTENIPAIASSIEAMKWNFTNRKEKNINLLNMRNYIIDELGKSFTWGNYVDYVNPSTSNQTSKKNDIELILLGPPVEHKQFYLPNTLSIAIAKNKEPPFCNINFKKALDRKGIVISIGAACLTSQSTSSHVLDAIMAPPVIKRGVIRISLGDYNTMDDVKKFCKVFCKSL